MTEARRGPEPPDISEKGGMKDGRPQRSNDRLFMQFLAFAGCADATPLADALARANVAGVLYEDVNDPRGIGLLTFSEDPDFFLDRVRPVLNGPGFSILVQKPQYTMLGRACHGLDKDDNDFVVGLIGKDLYPLSAIVQTMRKTQQTSLYLERLGPFFVGRALWQGAMAGSY